MKRATPTQETNRDARHRRRGEASHPCTVCNKIFPARAVMPASLVNENVATLIAAKVPDWSAHRFICRGCLNRFRVEWVRDAMEKERGELTALEQEVMNSLRAGEVIADNLNQEFDRSLTVGQRLADRVAEFGGSWRFITVFLVMMGLWIAVNSAYMVW